MRHALFLTTAMLIVIAGSARAQNAGAVPTLQQQPAGEIPQDQGPAHAPGSKRDAGQALTPSNANAGTTTVYAPPSDAKAVQWPCAQRRVSTISAGTIWSGPELGQGKDWDQDNTIAALAQKIASRRMPLDEVDAAIADFANSAGPDKAKKLTQLFVGTLEIINGNRDTILQGITRYAQGQERLAERMREESDKISLAQEDATATVGVAVDQQNKDFAWDQRIFRERKQALSYVCETPSLLERRAFEISKRIQARL